MKHQKDAKNLNFRKCTIIYNPKILVFKTLKRDWNLVGCMFNTISLQFLGFNIISIRFLGGLAHLVSRFACNTRVIFHVGSSPPVSRVKLLL